MIHFLMINLPLAELRSLSTSPTIIGEDITFILLAKTPTCAQCRMNKMFLDELAPDYHTIPVTTIDMTKVQSSGDLAKVVRRIPTTFLAKGSVIYYQKEGMMTRKEVKELMDLAQNVQRQS